MEEKTLSSEQIRSFALSMGLDAVRTIEETLLKKPHLLFKIETDDEAQKLIYRSVYMVVQGLAFALPPYDRFWDAKEAICDLFEMFNDDASRLIELFEAAGAKSIEVDQIEELVGAINGKPEP